MCSIFHVPEEMHRCMCLILHAPKEMNHCKCSILHAPEEMHHCMCAILHAHEEYINACARYFMCPILHCARRTPSLHVPYNSCARRDASLHYDRDCIVPKVCKSPKLHCARSLRVPESKEVTSINRAKKRYALFTHYLYSIGVIN